MITNKGRELATLLLPMIGYTSEIAETCSLIARHAATHARLSEDACNGHPLQGANPPVPIERMNKLQDAWDMRVEKQTEYTEARIIALVDSLPATDTGKLQVSFDGDPRGCTVKISLPPGQEKHH